MEPLISIIVPVYNAEKYLDQCIGSIMLQTYTNLEIILVDDGSRDTSGEICDLYAQKDGRIHVIHKQNEGPSAARNVALDIAKGEFFYFVDSDDYIEPSLCAQIMALFEKYPVDIVTFDCCRVSENGKLLGGTEQIVEGILSREKALEELMLGHINNYACNKIYKRHVFEGVRFPVGRTWEDMAVAYKLFLNADGIYCYPQKLYYYCMRSSSITATLNEKSLCDIFLARYNAYWNIKDRYPMAGDIVFGHVALSARRLYDRSLWAVVDTNILESAQKFLEDNKEKILKDNKSAAYWLYFHYPKLYMVFIIAKHRVGDVVKRINIRRK